MRTLSRRTALTILWTAAVALLPLPFAAMARGAVPVVRFGFLATVVGAYLARAPQGSTVAWLVLAILAAHALVYGVLLALAARVLGRWLPARVPAAPVAGVVALGLTVALACPIYHTPFDDASARATWSGLFQ